MKRIIVLLVIFTTLFSCKKDKLEDGKEIFIGKWRWVYSIKSESYVCDNPAVTTILTPSSIGGDNYYLEFKKKGCVTLYKNTDKLEKYRLVFLFFDSNSSLAYPSYSDFGIILNNDHSKPFGGYVKNDTLIETEFFPFESIDEICVSYTNYFVRE